MTDPIADFLTRIRNAQMAGHTSVRLPASRLKHALARVMEKQKMLAGVKLEKEGAFSMLEVELPERTLILERVSRPGNRVYIASDEIRRIGNGFGIAVISTSQGVMTGYEARSKGLGGEYICNIS